MEHLEISTRSRCEMVDITAELRSLVRRKAAGGRWQSGALALFCPHTTCGLTVNEGADPDVRRDMLAFFSRLAPEHGDYRHAEGNSDAHIKTTLHGPSLLLLVEGGELCLGTWQSVYLCEGDGPPPPQSVAAMAEVRRMTRAFSYLRPAFIRPIRSTVHAP